MSAPGLMVVGVGGMARDHLIAILKAGALDATTLPSRVVFVDIAPASLKKGLALFATAGLEAPRTFASLDEALAAGDLGVEVALIATPHNLHHAHAVACLQAGLDVWLEKPMVTTVDEAADLIRVRDETGRLLIVSFNGSLSPQVRKAVELIRAGEIGTVTAIHGSAWQGWKTDQTDTWRTDPVQSGGGFMFDTGAHLLNTACDLAGADFELVSAWLDNSGREVDILGSVTARTTTGAMVVLAGCGDTIDTCASDMKVFGTEGLIVTGMWGERLLLQRQGEDEPTEVEVVTPTARWETVLAVRSGVLPNPSPAELGLRMSHLWDMIKASAARGGVPVDAQMLVGTADRR
ncbi:MAG TPA: Gfo/Idh/MocA family oxidoreductase [Propionibacteriaceae bacterium]|nr:Gfo/Idh/MocA family oxidoreductase [Propionibacteriaceae bacterium]